MILLMTKAAFAGIFPGNAALLYLSDAIGPIRLINL